MAASGIKLYQVAIPGVPLNNIDYCVIIDASLQMHNATGGGTAFVDWGNTDHKLYIATTPEDLDYAEDQIFRKLHSSSCSDTYGEACSYPDAYSQGTSCADSFPTNTFCNPDD